MVLMRQLRNSVLTIINVVSFVGIVYYAIPGYYHVFTDGTGVQPTAIGLCVIVFLIAFLTAVQLTPKKEQRCPRCNADLTIKDNEKQSPSVEAAKLYGDEMLKKYKSRG